MITRRTFIASSIATACSIGRLAHARTPALPPLGIQLYMLRRQLAEDLPGTLAAIREIGYSQVEGGDLYGRTAEEFRAALKRARLTCVSIHTQLRMEGVPSLATDMDSIVATANALGVRHIVASFPVIAKLDLETVKDSKALRAAVGAMKLDDWKRTSDLLNASAKRLAEVGITLAYHNHNMEFVEYKGETAYDYLLRNTDPDLVKMQLDCAWMVAGRRDPVYYLTKHADRFTSLHVKDLAPGATSLLQLHPADVGAGIIDWTRVLSAARDAGVQYYFVEQEEPYERSALESARVAYTYLRTIPGFAAVKA